MATPMTYSAEIFAGALIYFAEYAAATSDSVTKPIASSELWKEIVAVQSWTPKRNLTEEMAEIPDPDLGWRVEPREFTHAIYAEIVARTTTELFHRLHFGLAAAAVKGTAQTPGVKSDCSVKGWVKVQLREHIGTDRFVYDAWSHIHILGDPPAATKATQLPALRIWQLKSALNAFNMPAAA